MFSPEKDFHKLIVESLGKDGKSISSLAKDLEKHGFKHHRLILTGYLRALTDLKILKEREIPPAKVYIPLKSLPDNIYEKIGKKCREAYERSDDLILFTLYRLMKRPIFESELRMAGVDEIGILADDDSMKEARKVLKRAGVQIPSNQKAFIPEKTDFEEQYLSLIENLIIEIMDIKHLVRETRQTKLI